MWRFYCRVFTLLSLCAAAGACSESGGRRADVEVSDQVEPVETDAKAAPGNAANQEDSGAQDGSAKSGSPEPVDGSPNPVQRVEEPDPKPVDAGDCLKVQSGSKRRNSNLGIMITPKRPRAGQRLRILAATLDGEEKLALRLQKLGKKSEDSTKTPEQNLTFLSGVPAASIADFIPNSSGKFQLAVGRKGENLACVEFKVGRASKLARPVPPLNPESERVWQSSRDWNLGEEALFSAWVRFLFHAPPGEDLAWAKLDEVTSDSNRNLLHNFMDWGEDDPKDGIHLKPDCADTPYFLRAYFAWKRKLPFAFSGCTRGNAKSPPRCRSTKSSQQAPDLKSDWKVEGARPSLLKVIEYFFRRSLAWGVHTGNGRVPHDDEIQDFYPLSLRRKSLRPGTIYADPYGHILVVTEWVAPRGKKPGILYAVDGQPDGSITRKRFWPGNFLWNADPKWGGTGFKAFRPLSRERVKNPAKWSGGRVLLAEEIEGDDGSKGQSNADRRQLIAWSDARIEKNYGDIERQPRQLSSEQFYDTMDRLMTPGTRDPVAALEEAVLSLAEAARVRVRSVANGVQWQADHPGGLVDMPEGYSIFETTGPWENFSTPSRDLRLLIAIDEVMNFENKVRRQKEAFGISGATELESLLEKLRARREQLLNEASYGFVYRRSDQSEFGLLLRDLVTRVSQFEMAYNPNDCPEVRWGASLETPEGQTCRKRAPVEQIEKMKSYRPWFRDRRRPARGEMKP